MGALLSMAIVANCSSQPLLPLRRASQVLGTVKNALLVLVAIALFNEVVTPLQGLGYTLSVAGFLIYNHIKMSESPPKG